MAHIVPDRDGCHSPLATLAGDGDTLPQSHDLAFTCVDAITGTLAPMDSNRRDDAAPWGSSPTGGGWASSTRPLDYPDPAYASQAYEYPALSGSPQPYPTSVLPPQQYGSYGSSYGSPPEPPPPPRRSNTFWLWVIGCGALVVIIALIVTLVILINREDNEPAVVATPTTRTSTPAAPAIPSMPALPSFTIPMLPGTPPSGGNQIPTETVVYEVTGGEKAFNITYNDGTGGLQTEFNVKLPWHKEVKMTTNQAGNALVIGSDLAHEVTCTITVNGARRDAMSGKFASCGNSQFKKPR